MSKVLPYLLAFVRLLLIAVLTILTVIVALPFFHLSGKSRKVSYATAKTWGRAALFLLNVKVNLLGVKPNEKVLVMPNHQSYLDIFLILGYYPASIVAKKEIANWPVLRFAIQLGRVILVDRANLRGTLHTMHAIDAEVKSGGSVILFPEGTTTLGPLTRSFKAGSFKIAEETQTPIVPVAIKYRSRDIGWDKETFLHNFFSYMGYWRMDVDLWFGTPVLGGEAKALLQQTKSAIDTQLSLYL